MLPPLLKEKNMIGRNENAVTTSQAITKPFYFEDFHVGQRFVTNARTVTEADVVNFAGLSWDHNPLHTDEVYSAKTGLGKRIAHGLLGVVIHSGLAYQLTEGTLLTFLEIVMHSSLMRCFPISTSSVQRWLITHNRPGAGH